MLIMVERSADTHRVSYLPTANRCMFRSGWSLLGVAALLSYANSDAQTEIYRCPQPDGTIAFQEQPCPSETPPQPEREEPPEDSTDDFFSFENPFDAPPEEAPQKDTEARPPSAERSQCQKLARDAIDAIEQEMLQEYAPEQRDEYLARLTVHTRELRACDRL